MTLAARCPACGTVFRVVQDQLRVSDGWVRCGRCAEVFNAIESLVEVEADVPPRSSVRGSRVAADGRAEAGRQHHEPAIGPVGARTGSRANPAAASQPTRGRSLPEQGHEGAPDAGPRPASDPDPADPSRTGTSGVADASREPPSPRRPSDFAGGLAGETAAPRALLDRPSAPWPADRAEPAGPRGSDFSDDVEPVRVRAPGFDATRDDRVAPLPGESPTPANVGPAAPSFLRRAERAARWQRPAVRAALGGCAALLSLLAAAQLTWLYRDEVAARWPSARPGLLLACAGLDCRLEHPRAIDAIVVDHSALLRAEGEAGLHRLALTLRNRSSRPVALPAVDLTLSDARGALLSRRVLSAGDLGAGPDAALAGGGSVTLQVQIAIDTPGLAGYTIETFYP